jgi:hypothetical protein
MADSEDLNFFKLRKMGKTYISKVFQFGALNPEKIRNVTMVLEGSDVVHLGEIDGALCLRITGQTRKTQVTAIVTQDDKKIRRLSLQTFKPRSGGWIESSDKEDFTFRSDEFEKLVSFAQRIEFLDMSNIERFQIEDLSVGAGPKTIIDASDKRVIQSIQSMSLDQRKSLLEGLQAALSIEEVNILLGRKQGLEVFETQMILNEWREADWQKFFALQKWVFGYGLDYRIMRQFDREVTLGGGGTDNQNKPVVDYLMNFTDFTVLVEIKLPETRIFRPRKAGRAGTWEFTADFTGAVSQVLEQRAEWQANANAGEHYNKSGDEKLLTRTKSPKAVLIIGSSREFVDCENVRAANLMKDTFELFRQECRGIDILTFDEVLERARFITTNR